jgi:glycosyltransferase involved in cell wall biosynthesis
VTVLCLAAHGFAEDSLPLGGGAAVCSQLLREWSRTQPFPVQLVNPAILGADAPSGSELVRYNERLYAAFCRRFETAATAEVLRHDPARTVVLVNDISEGPDFSRLAAAAYPIVTIYHVDVVAYVAAIYGRQCVAPATLVRCYENLRRSVFGALIPGMAKLVFDKQRDSLRYSRAVVVPSRSMRELLLNCYPDTPPERIQVLPWGACESGCDEAAVAAEAAALRHQYAIPRDALVLLTLSRISVEKGQDLLLRALLDWERRSDFPRQPVWLFICGDAAYMQGHRFLRRLQSLAARLRKTRVIFTGHVTGIRKQAFFALAGLYVFPSRHESYGLTLVEALRAGLPAVCLDHHGAREVLRPDCGLLVPKEQLREAIARLLLDPDLRARMGRAARDYAATLLFSDAAAALGGIIQHCIVGSSPGLR